MMTMAAAVLKSIGLLAGLLAACPQATSEKRSAANDAPSARFVIKLVSDLESAVPVSDLERSDEITESVIQKKSADPRVVGERSVLWVRNAHVDGRFFFEQIHEGKYIGRRAVLEIDPAQLGAGQHVIEPGGHAFAYSEQTGLSSSDPEIRIDGRTLLLRLHPVTVYGVDEAKSGPPEFRPVPMNLGIFILNPEFKLEGTALPDCTQTADPRSKPGKGASPLTDALSRHDKAFYPLSVWLPSNQKGQGYLLYPTGQSFRVTPEGKADLESSGAPRVPGVQADGGTLTIPHRTFSGRVSTIGNLSGALGNTRLKESMILGATLTPLQFRAGVGTPPPDFFLGIGGDLSRRPHKFFLADNTGGDEQAVRLLALEWNTPVFPEGEEAEVSLRFLEMAGRPGLKEPEVRIDCSPYQPSNPLYRLWTPVEGALWKNGRDEGPLRFRCPRGLSGFVVFRFQVFEKGDPLPITRLSGEIPGILIDPRQTGTASFSTNKGRNVFQAGEDIAVTLILRSTGKRPAGTRGVVLSGPEGQEEILEVQDPGDSWWAQDLKLSGTHTVDLLPGRYSLGVRGLPPGISPFAFAFEMVGRDKPSLYTIVKSSKYTEAMNELERTHLEGKPVDLDRTVSTLAGLGYTRMDLMVYSLSHSARPYTWREELAATDPRLPAPDSVFTPTPRDQILNACVRHQIEYSDVWLTWNDFHLPRYVDSYIHASERWISREVQSMRHSPAFDGMMLYDEMYNENPCYIVPHHKKYFPEVRAKKALEVLQGLTPAKIQQGISRYLERPKGQRDPKDLENFIKYADFEQHGWGDYVDRVVAAAKEIAPKARFGTYTRTWGMPGTNDGMLHGYPPDLHRSLDIISHVHYSDNSTGWVLTPMLAQILRTGQGKTLYVNLPVTHESRTQWDGQYQRHMAFAQLAQGANGIAQWGSEHSFKDGPNPTTAIGYETTGPLNNEVLRPFGELVNRTGDGYRKVGIVSTLRQHAMSDFKTIGVAHQTEGLWIACWRLGYPAVFLREEHLKESLENFSVIFVPGLRYDGELEPWITAKLREAIARGTRVVVEQGSTLDLPGLTKLSEFAVDTFHVGDKYFPTHLDDELKRTYEKSQPIVDYLAPKFREWGIERAAEGSYQVGPCWRDGGDIQYLIMANFDDPDYGHTVKQQMAKPLLLPLEVPARRGKAAYDLLAQKELDVASGPSGRRITLDMRRMQGAIVAFLPDRIAALDVRYQVGHDPGRVRIKANLVAAKGNALDGVFPVEIRVEDGISGPTFHRVLGRNLAVELDLPRTRKPRTVRFDVREALSGCSARFEVPCDPIAGPLLERLASEQPELPYPHEVATFLAKAKTAAVVPAKVLPGAEAAARALVDRLKKKGVDARVVSEASAYRIPRGDPKSDDPLGDGFHTWAAPQDAIAPALEVDEPVILLGGRGSSFLLDQLVETGYVSRRPLGGPGLAVRPSIQVARKGLHFAHDTLCLIANEAEGLNRAVDRLFGGFEEPHSVATSRYDSERVVRSSDVKRSVPALEYGGSNELILDLQFDPAGNLYAGTWGHGKNLYSLTPEGRLRFARHLPEMGVVRMNVYPDRVYAFTSAGGRLYRMTLEGNPVAQARLGIDPGPVGDDDYSLGDADYQYLPDQHLLIVNLGDRMRVLDEQFNIVSEWLGREYQTNPNDLPSRRQFHSFVVNPEGTRIADLESTRYATAGIDNAEAFDGHLVLRALDGKELAECSDVDNGRKISARPSWSRGASGPTLRVKGRRLQLDAALHPVSEGPLEEVVPDGRRLLLPGPDGRAFSAGPFEILPSFHAVSPDGQWVATLDELGELRLYGTARGSLKARLVLPERGGVLRFSPDSRRVFVGGYRGRIFACDLDGRIVWQSRLGDFNDVLGKDLALYDPAFPDRTEKLWPSSTDRPEELDALVRLGDDRLVNGNCEGEGGWKAKSVTYHPEGFLSPRSLRVGADTVGQDVSRFLGHHATWVLEFFYRALAPETKPELLAGLLSESQNPESVARRLRADGTWRFARIVTKSGVDCRTLRIGFSARKGEVLVDQVRLRQIRFPSINYMLYEPFHAVKPVVLENPLLAMKYDLIGPAREQAPNRVFVPLIRSGAPTLVESAFLQNGRLNDVGSNWYIQPYGPEPEISLGLKEPRWVSMVGLYFNAYDEANVTPHFDIYVTDVDAKKDVRVASIRNNGQIFRLVKFEPVRASVVKIRLINSIARLRTLTEVELYGPLSGKEGAPGFTDVQGQNTYMGNFSRVDSRSRKLVEPYSPSMVRKEDEGRWFAPLSGVLAGDDRLFVAQTFGKNTVSPVQDPAKELARGRAGGLGYTPYGALYGGLLLRPGNDGRFYSLNPESGTELWSVELGERLLGCPVAIEGDVYVAGDRRVLYRLDLASGMTLGEVALTGLVSGSLATDGRLLYLVTEDGFLQCFRAADLSLRWKLPVAPFTDSTPAVDGGIVYVADQKGTALAVDAAAGKVLWRTELGDEFSRCPVVTADHVIYGCRGGFLAVLNRADGKQRWSKKVESRFSYEPVPLGDKLLFFRRERGIVANLSDGQEAPLRCLVKPQGKEKPEPQEFSLREEPIASIGYYKGFLYIVERHGDKGHTARLSNAIWDVDSGSVHVLRPAVSEPTGKGKP
jgi:outer membrane protein assembly factor BamB